MPSRTLLLAVALALAAGCAEPDSYPTDFKYLHATVITPRCATAGCHSYGNSQQSTSLTGPIDLSTANVACGNLRDWLEVLGPNGSPAPSPTCGLPTSDPLMNATEPESDLARLLDGTYGKDLCDYNAIPQGYTEMPADFPLTSAENDAFKKWIEAGAPCD